MVDQLRQQGFFKQGDCQVIQAASSKITELQPQLPAFAGS